MTVPAAVVAQLVEAIDAECLGRTVAERLALPLARARYHLAGRGTPDAPAWVDPDTEGNETM